MPEYSVPEEMQDILGGSIVIELLGFIAIISVIAWKYDLTVAWPLG